MSKDASSLSYPDIYDRVEGYMGRDKPCWKWDCPRCGFTCTKGIDVDTDSINPVCTRCRNLEDEMEFFDV